jgi:glycosyltransferase involved in cell wall biosynthesis
LLHFWEIYLFDGISAMNILLITPVWGHLGGIERYVADCVEEFTLKGHVCSVVYGRKSDQAVESGIASILHGAYHVGTLSMFESPEDASGVEQIDAILKAEQPDVIFMTGVRNYALLARLKAYGRLVPMSHDCSLVCMRMTNTTYVCRKICTHKLGPRCLLHGCGVRKNPDNTGDRFIFNSLRQHQMLLDIYRGMDVHVVASNYMKQRLIEHGFQPDRLKVIGCFTNVKPQAPSLPGGQLPIISFVGRMNRYKGADYLLRALVNVTSPFRCSVIGDGEYLPYCRDLAHKLGLSNVVEFLGRRSTEEITQHLRGVSVAVVPSVFPEPFGIVGLEAMMCAKPVVAFNVGGIPDWLKDGKTGYLVPVKDTKALGEAIDSLLIDPHKAARMGIEGRRLVTSSFDKEQILSRLLSLFREKAAKAYQHSSLVVV